MAFAGLCTFAVLGGLLACSSTSRDTPVPVTIEVVHAMPKAAVSVTRLNYYLGQWRLRRSDGRWFESPGYRSPAGDYALIDAVRPDASRVEAFRLDPGHYDTLEFQIGVDAKRNEGGAQSGALDPARGMYWTWKTGFIFFALEAERPGGASVLWHIGGDNDLVRTLVLPLQNFELKSGRPSAIRLSADVAALLQELDHGLQPNVMGLEGAAPVADAYAAMFKPLSS
jgi:hypothetical protein